MADMVNAARVAGVGAGNEWSGRDLRWHTTPREWMEWDTSRGDGWERVVVVVVVKCESQKLMPHYFRGC